MKGSAMFLQMIVLLSSFAVLLAGCSQEPEGPPTVQMWQFGGVPGYREWIRGAVKQFNVTHTETQVDLEMSFVDQKQVMDTVEAATIHAFTLGSSRKRNAM